MTDPIRVMMVVLGGSVFVLILSLWLGGLLLWSARRGKRDEHVRHRLGLGEDHGDPTRVLHLWIDGQRRSTRVTAGPTTSSLRARLEQVALQIGWTQGPLALLAIAATLLLAIMAAAVAVSGNLLMGAAVGIAVVVTVRIFLQATADRRESLFANQFVDAMELAARSLRAGHPLLGAFQLIAEEMAPPVSTLFAEMCQKHEMGASIEESLRDASHCSSSSDMQLFATSVAIQLRTGGNLADLMDRLAAVIRQRMRLGRRLRVLTAQTQISKRVLLALPLIMFIVLSLINAEYMEPFYTTTPGKLLLVIAVAGMCLGAWMMNRLVRLEF